MKDSVVKVIQIKLSLQGKLMVRVQDVERESGPRSIESGGVPSLPKKLLIAFEMHPHAAATILELKVVDTVHVEDYERILERFWDGAGVFVT